MGVKRQKIRYIQTALIDKWQTEHPFSHENLYVNPDTSNVYSQDELGRLLELVSKQHAMPEVLMPVLKLVRYDDDTKHAASMRLAEDMDVEIDPKRRYGKPIVSESGVPTYILSECYKANNDDAEFVADWYSVRKSEVMDAVRFESNFRGIAV